MRKTTLAGRGFGSITRSISGFTRSLFSVQGALAGLSFGAVTAAVIRGSDAFTQMSARLDLVSDSTEAAARAQDLLLQVANRAGTDFQETVELYTRIARATDEMGLSQNRLVGVTDTISKALALSGASAESANAALIQLSQGLAAGTFRGDELNSVMEQTPRLAQLIADGLGVEIGKLRKLGSEGELTTDRVITAIERGASSVEQEFSRVPTTVRRAFQRMSNDIFSAMENIDTSPIERSIEDIRQAIGQSNIGQDFALAFNTVFEVVGDLSKWVIENWKYIQAATISLMGQIHTAWLSMKHAVDVVIGGITGSFNSMINFVQRDFSRFVAGIADALDYVPGTDSLVEGLRGYSAEVHAAGMSNDGLIATMQRLDAEYAAQRQAIEENTRNAMRKALTATKDQTSATEELNAALREGREEAASSGSTTTGPTKEQIKALEKLVQARQRARDQLQGMTLSLQEQIVATRDGRVAAVEFSLEHGRMAETLAAAGDGAAQYKQQLVELNRELARVQAEQDFAEPSARYRDRIRELDQLGLSQKAYNQAVFEAQEALFMETEARSRLTSEQRAQIGLLSAELSVKQATFAANQESGLMTLTEQYRQHNDIVRQQISLLQEEIALVRARPASYSNSQHIAQLQAQIEGLRGSYKSLGDDIRRTFQDSMEDGVASVLRGTASIKDVFENMVDAVLDQMARIFAQEITAGITGTIMPATGGGGTGSLLGSIVTSLGSSLFGALERGGPAIANRPYVVGESGPEVFVPGTSGTVMSNSDVGVGGVVLNMNISTPDAQSFRASQDQIARDYAAAIQRAQRFR